ncbi:MAG: KUP/HAK/KT family potassium transporter [Candidatus Moranbacteria bacterium]|nr:KUP/HAK/KT family potassium transporter [Candidatus Moranbacteria bacterium]
MQTKTSTGALTLAALGIVYGDLGTSPLYAFNEVFFGSGRVAVTPELALRVASLIFWMLLLVVGIKYIVFVLRADHKGEGGIFALFAILQQFKGRRIGVLSFLLMFAGGLLFGDGLITPAISVLSAVEGLKIFEPRLEAWVVPLTLFILAVIFFLQKNGTRSIGKIYGPIMLAWFVALAWLGLRQIVHAPEVLLAMINPLSAWALVRSLDLIHLLFLFGAVFLVLTGSEALYADLGHLGKKPIRLGWFVIVFPALLLNYAGQAAYLVRGGAVLYGNIFYSLVPEQWLPAMIMLATMAAFIASVALLFGAYSLAAQAIALKILPRLRIVHTDRETEGQIYLPVINWTLFVGSTLLVIGFGSATRLAAAYGFAVSGVMLITSMAMFFIATHHWSWKHWSAASVFGIFILIDVWFLIANSVKFTEGGFIPFLLGLAVFFVIATWRFGRQMFRTAYDAYVADKSIAWFLAMKKRLEERGGILRDERARYMVETDRAAVFLVSRPIVNKESRIPVKLRVHLKRRGTIPKNILFLNIEQEKVPYLKRHAKIIDLGDSVYAVHAVFGFMEDPDAAEVLRDLYHRHHIFGEKFRRCTIEVSEDEFFIDQDVPRLRRFVSIFFRLLSRWSVPAYRYFGLSGDASVGLSKTVVPVHLSAQGIRIEIPEFPLKGKRDALDPDTLEPTNIAFTKV